MNNHVFFLDMDATNANKYVSMDRGQGKINPSSFSRLMKEKELKKNVENMISVNIISHTMKIKNDIIRKIILKIFWYENNS